MKGRAWEDLGFCRGGSRANIKAIRIPASVKNTRVFTPTFIPSIPCSPTSPDDLFLVPFLVLHLSLSLSSSGPCPSSS